MMLYKTYFVIFLYNTFSVVFILISNYSFWKILISILYVYTRINNDICMKSKYSDVRICSYDYQPTLILPEYQFVRSICGYYSLWQICDVQGYAAIYFLRNSCNRANQYTIMQTYWCSFLNLIAPTSFNEIYLERDVNQITSFQRPIFCFLI